VPPRIKDASRTDAVVLDRPGVIHNPGVAGDAHRGEEVDEAMGTRGLGLRADDGTLARLVDDPASVFYFSAGPVLAILLGMALAPVRHATSASNFTFVFLALTIAVARLGGRWPAVATSVSSALSLDFFLTEPYRHLAIADKHDVIAFVGLTVCGLIAAGLGRSRDEDPHRLVHEALRVCTREADLTAQLTGVVTIARGGLPLSGAVVRDPRNFVLAAAMPIGETLPVPQVLLPDDALDMHDERSGPLPIDGARISLSGGGRRLGWLDVWGNGGRASATAGQALFDVASIVGILLARDDRDASVGH